MQLTIIKPNLTQGEKNNLTEYLDYTQHQYTQIWQLLPPGKLKHDMQITIQTIQAMKNNLNK